MKPKDQFCGQETNVFILILVQLADSPAVRIIVFGERKVEEAVHNLLISQVNLSHAASAVQGLRGSLGCPDQI
jgi:hypothetical protein